MTHLQLVSAIIVPTLIQSLIDTGWEMEEDKDSARISLNIYIMLGKHDGVSFVAYLDHLEAPTAEVIMLEFNKDDAHNKDMADTAVKDYEPFQCAIEKLESLTTHYRARAYDVAAEIASLESEIDNLHLEGVAVELLGLRA